MKKLMVVLAMFTTGMVAAQSGSVKKETVLLITKNLYRKRLEQEWCQRECNINV